jgi:acyl dehydratase
MRTFDSFSAGELLGTHTETVDAALLEAWRALFPAAAQAEQGLLCALLMRAYMRILPERPPGNVHARQSYEFIRAAQLGARLTTRLNCRAAERKGERRWVHLESETSDANGALVCRGAMSMLWAA